MTKRGIFTLRSDAPGRAAQLASPPAPPISRKGAKRYAIKLFCLSFLLSSLIAPALAFGLTWLGYLLTGVESLRSLESLSLLDAERASVFALAAFAVSVLLGIAAFLLGRVMRLPQSTGGRLAPLALLFFSLPVLTLADQGLNLYVLDNPFAAARHLLMLTQGWGAALVFWQVLFALAFLAGAPGTRPTLGPGGNPGRLAL